jgi:hypothetical protein
MRQDAEITGRKLPPMRREVFMQAGKAVGLLTMIIHQRSLRDEVIDHIALTADRTQYQI